MRPSVTKIKYHESFLAVEWCIKWSECGHHVHALFDSGIELTSVMAWSVVCPACSLNSLDLHVGPFSGPLKWSEVAGETLH